MEPAPTARTTVRGFHGTPVTSGDEDSDYGVARRNDENTGSGASKGPRRGRKKPLVALDDVVSANCSPVLRPSGSPAMSGIAKLRMQLEPFSLDTSATSSRASSPGAKVRTQLQPQAAVIATTALSMTSSTVTASRVVSPLSPTKKTYQHKHQTSLTSQTSQTSQSSQPGRPDFTIRNYEHRPDSSSSTKAAESDVSGARTGQSSRSTSHDGVSSNTSGDETGPEMSGSSYIIQLKSDFISESVRNTAPISAVNDASEATDSKAFMFDTDLDTDEFPATLVSTSAATAMANNKTTTDGTNDATQGVAPKKMTADDFEPLRCLGKGSYGTVLLVKQNSTGRLYAQKQFKKASLVVHKKLVEQTKTERQILESVNRHPFVVKLFYAFQDREKLYLILEYGQGGELFTHLSSERMFTEATAAFYMAEMALALSHLHDTLGVVYRDLKPENCLLDSEGHLLLTDFGLSKVALPGARSRAGSTATVATADSDDACCNSILGTVEYMAPEVVLGKKYGRAVDWWSFGALGFDLMTGNPPFRGRNNAKIQENIVKQKLVMPYFLSPDAKDLLIRLLRKEPRKRLGANMPKDLETIKSHRFFRKIDWVRLAARELEPPIQPVITDPELAENFATEFTDLPLSPTMSPAMDVGGRDPDPYSSSKPLGRNTANANGAGGASFRDDPFGGFSFVASSSLLNGSYLPSSLSD
ncbi:hypothetical protein SEUCBS139899_005459 [Sporothrix eucalyptigena]|uniref:Uncharacterized protein n=1 Tax=Sporothrix eucalyptigena TaxID=1812306 RepID=A0ABP0BKR2_9PEZI